MVLDDLGIRDSLWKVYHDLLALVNTAVNLISSRAKRLDHFDWRRSRLRRIYRGWQRVRKHPLQMSRWSEPLYALSGRQGAFVAFASSILLIPFSQAIVPLPAEAKLPPAAVTLLPFHSEALLGLAILYLVNAWLIDRHLAQRTLQETRIRPWLRWLRFAICVIPLLGSFAIFGWRWILSRPQWAFRNRVLSPPLARPLRSSSTGPGWDLTLVSCFRQFVDATNRRLTTDVGIGFLELGNAVVLGFAVYSRTTHEPEPTQRLVVAALGIVFHLIASRGMFWHLSVEARRRELSGFHLWIHRSLALCWLVPVPYLAVMGLLGVWMQWFFGDSALQEKTLAHRAYSRRGAHFLPLGLSLEETVRRRWRGAPWRERLGQPGATLPPAVEPTSAQDRLLWLYRIKSVVLAFDAVAVSWILLWLAGRRRGGTAAVDNAMDIAVNVSGLLCVLAVLVMAAYFIALGLRISGPLDVLDRHPYAQYLAITQISWLAGLEAGRDLFHRDAHALAQTLQAVGILGCVAAFVALLSRIFLPGGERIKGPHHGFLGLVGFLVVGFAGQSAAGDEAYARGLMSWVTAFTITAPVWHLLMGRFLLGWLLRPFEIGHLSAETVPAHVRRTLRFLTATLLLPAGGLAIPLWIHVRHRKWPSWERRLLEERSDA